MAKNKKRILYLSADSGVALDGTKGASIHIREFVETLSSVGHDVTVAVSKLETGHGIAIDYAVRVLPEVPEVSLTNLVEVSANERQSLKEAANFLRNKYTLEFILELHNTVPFDLIYERYSLFNIAGHMAASALGIPLVLEINAPLVYEARQYRKLHHLDLAKSVESFLFSNSDHIVAVSSGLKDYILKIAGDAEVSVIPNGVSLENFDSAERNMKWRRKMTHHPETDFLIGFVGSIKPWHGVEFLIDAFAKLNTQDQAFSLCIVGNGDKNYQSALEQQCQNGGFNKRVKFLGAVPYESIPEVMKSMDVLVAPYPQMENFYFSPLKIFEYMASKQPIVSSAIGQIEDVLTDGKNALLVPAGDASSLQKALLRIRQDSQLARRLSEAAHSDVSTSHLWIHRLEKVSEIIESLAGGKKDQATYAHKL